MIGTVADNSEIKISADFEEICDTLVTIQENISVVKNIYNVIFKNYAEFYTGGGAYALDNYGTQVNIHLQELIDLYNKIIIYFNYANNTLQEKDQELSTILNKAQQSEGD